MKIENNFEFQQKNQSEMQSNWIHIHGIEISKYAF